MKFMRHMQFWCINANKIINSDHDGNGCNNCKITQFDSNLSVKYSYIFNRLKFKKHIKQLTKSGKKLLNLNDLKLMANKNVPK